MRKRDTLRINSLHKSENEHISGEISRGSLKSADDKILNTKWSDRNIIIFPSKRYAWRVIDNNLGRLQSWDMHKWKSVLNIESALNLTWISKNSRLSKSPGVMLGYQIRYFSLKVGLVTGFLKVLQSL